MKTLMFNRNTLAQQWVDTELHRPIIAQLKEMGYQENPPLVQMYNPDSKKHVIIHVDDVKKYEAEGFYRNPTYVYHPTEGTRLVSEEQAQGMYTQGWYDNPGKFPGRKLGIEKARTTLVLPKEAA